MSGMKVMNMGDENIQHSGSRGGDRPEDNDQEVRALVRQVRELNSQMEALRQEMKQAQRKLIPLLGRRGDRWSDQRGSVQIVREGVRRVYDADALDRLILSDPLRYSWLRDFRREFATAAHIDID